MRLFSTFIIALAFLVVLGLVLSQGTTSLFLLVVVPAGMFVLYKLLLQLFRSQKYSD